MKLGFLELMDTSGLSEENKKFFESLDEKMGEAFEKQVKGYLADEVKLEDLRKSIKDAADSINDIKEKGFAGIDKKTFEEKVNELENAILRVKASTEVGKNGEVKIKSVYEQLHEQLKEYIAADKKGVMSLDLKSACQSAPGNKLGLNLVLEKKLQLLLPGPLLRITDLRLTQIYQSIRERKPSLENMQMYQAQIIGLWFMRNIQARTEMLHGFLKVG